MATSQSPNGKWVTRDFAGVTSDALILFSDAPDGAFAPVTAPLAAPAGCQVSFSGVKSAPLPPSNKAVEAWRRLEREGALRVGDDGVARLDTRSRSQREKADVNGVGGGDADDGPELLPESEPGQSRAHKAAKAGLPLVCRVPEAVKNGGPASSFWCTSAVAGEVA